MALGFHFQALQDYVEGTTSLLPGQQKSSLIHRAVATGLSGSTFAQQQLMDVKCLSVFMHTWRDLSPEALYFIHCHIHQHERHLSTARAPAVLLCFLSSPVVV